eukprot:jgi/Bigna1/134371/aug1.25_g9079
MLLQKHNPLRKTVSDLIISDMTGSGKTLAFALPIISNTNNFSDKLQHIVVVPSRELSVQTTRVFKALCKGGSKRRKNNPVRVLRISGLDNDAAADTVAREKPHILIGTPRILSHVLLKLKAVDTTHLVHVVFDEIDQLISMQKDRKACLDIMAVGTRHRLNPMMRQGASSSSSSSSSSSASSIDHETVAGTQRRQLVFVTATPTDDVFKIAESTMQPGFVQVTAMDNIDEWQRRRQFDYRMKNNTLSNKISLPSGEEEEAESPQRDGGHSEKQRSHHYHQSLPSVIDLCREAAAAIKALKKQSLNRQVGALVFMRGRDKVEDAAGYLKLGKIRTECLHQSTSRQERSRAFRLMADGQIDALVGTDMLARGLDIEGITDVINIGLPRSTNMYMHRAGRAGRLNGRNAKSSQVITLISAKEFSKILSYGKAMGVEINAAQIKGGKITKMHTADFELLYKESFGGAGAAGKDEKKMDKVSPPLSPEAVKFLDPEEIKLEGVRRRLAMKKKIQEMKRRRQMSKRVIRKRRA